MLTKAVPGQLDFTTEVPPRHTGWPSSDEVTAKPDNLIPGPSVACVCNIRCDASVQGEKMTVLIRRRRKSRRRLQLAEQAHQRLDIQGLRMIAVLTVFAFHLCGWPRGGFVGVDVFFVISGFLITGNLLRMAESRGNVSFGRFYWNRVRRIVPAATVVLVLTYVASVLVFLPFRAHQIGIDALFAFFFLSNWWLGTQATDYFAGGNAVSPIQHYWSLSIEEQFYFVWPALIFAIGVVIARKSWTHGHRMRLAAAVMACVVAVSLGWSLYETAIDPTWAYFNTAARVWELGVGALLATAVGALALIPKKMKPWLSWTGLALIAASLVLISDDSAGFPAPWALLPVAGAAFVVAAGVEGEPTRQQLLQNPVSVYVGNISYSLYLVHWPVIVILGALVPHNGYFYVMAVALTFGLAIGSYHFIENPMRRGDWNKARGAVKDIRRRRYLPERSSGYAAVAVLSLLTVSLVVFTLRPHVPDRLPPSLVAAAPGEVGPTEAKPRFDPLTTALQEEITQAVEATEWPQLEPSMEAQLEGRGNIGVPESFAGCGQLRDDFNDPQRCSWGLPTAPTRVVIVGDSVASRYAWPLSEIALRSEGQIQVHDASLPGCQFVDADVFNADANNLADCLEGKPRQIDYINSTKPDVVVITNIYSVNRPLVGGGTLTPEQYREALVRQIAKFQSSTKKVVLLSAPPGDKNPQECFGSRSSVPADCLGQVLGSWDVQARGDQATAQVVRATWIDSRPWFCSAERGWYCPAFVGSTPVRYDTYHMGFAYAMKIYPSVLESFRAAGVF